MTDQHTGDDRRERPTFRVGEIASATGMTVRTLHYYEEIGLLQPAQRTPAGHRVYGSDTVARLYAISQLRQLGFRLDGIRQSLDSVAQVDVRTMMREHLAMVEERLATEQRLKSTLTRLVGTLESNNEDTTGDLLSVLEDMTMLEAKLEKNIAILVYADIAAAADYLSRVYGFGPTELSEDPDGNVVHGLVQAGGTEFWLHPPTDEFGLRSPRDVGAATATMAIIVDDVDAHHRHASEQGATIRYEPTDQPYGYREYGAIDLEGHLWSFMKPLD